MSILNSKIKVFNFTMLKEDLAETSTFKNAVDKFTKYAERSEQDFQNLLEQRRRERDNLHDSLGISGMNQSELLNDIVHDIASEPVTQRERYLKKLAVVGEQLSKEMFAGLAGISSEYSIAA